MTHPSPLLVLAGLPDDLRTWAAEHETFAETWAGCERPEWLVAMAVSAGIDRAVIVAVTCDCIERVRAGRNMPEAWALAKSWARGQVDGRTAWAAGFRASADARDLHDPLERSTLQAAAAAAFACDDEADDGYYASRAHAAEAVRLAVALAPERRTELATHVRRRIDATQVLEGLEALAERETTPPPDPFADDNDSVHAPVTPRTLLRLRS